MQTIVNATSALITYDRCAIGILEKGKLRLGAISGTTEVDRSKPDVKRLEELVQWVYFSGVNVSVTQGEAGDIVADRPETEEKFRSVFQETGMRSFYGVILSDEEGKLGALAFESKEPIVFDEGTQDLLQILVNQATVAVRNAQLYRQVPLAGFFKPLADRQRKLLAIPKQRRRAWAVGLAVAAILLLVPWRLRIAGPARILPGHRASVTSGVDGVVASVRKHEGDRVAAGEVIAALKDEAYTARLAEASAALDIAASDVARQRALGDAGALFEAQSRREELDARIAFAREELRRTRLTAPVSGVIVTAAHRGAGRAVLPPRRGAVRHRGRGHGDGGGRRAGGRRRARAHRPEGVDEDQHLPHAHVRGSRRPTGSPRPRGRGGAVSDRRGARGQPGRHAEDGDARHGKDLGRQAQHRDTPPAKTRSLALAEDLALASVSAAHRPRSLLAARSGDTAAALAERHGAAGDRPALRSDLVIRRVVQMGEGTWVVKNPEAVKYYNFADAEWVLISLFDGTRTRAEIFEEYRGQFPGEDIRLQLILDFEEMLRKIDLIAQSIAERNLTLLAGAKTARQRAADERAEGRNIFFIPFHVLDPDRFLNRTVRYVRWIWTPPVVAVWLIGAIWTVSIFISHWQPIWSGTLELYAFLSKPLLDAIQFFLLLSIIGCIHEFAHAYATKIYGGEVHDIGIALLYVITPAFYCDTTDSLLFESKWHRLWVTTAGIYIEGFICAAATLAWVASYPDTFLHDFAYKTMLFTGVSTVFFNINPLIKIDGYYALTSLLEIPELREESIQYLGAVFQKKVLRLPVEVPEVSRRKRRIYWIYGPLALAYLGVLMTLIGGLFFNFYSKYFPNVAGVLLVLTLLRLFRKRVRLVTRTVRLFYLDKKDLLMSSRSRKAPARRRRRARRRPARALDAPKDPNGSRVAARDAGEPGSAGRRGRHRGAGRRRRHGRRRPARAAPREPRGAGARGWSSRPRSGGSRNRRAAPAA